MVGGAETFRSGTGEWARSLLTAVLVAAMVFSVLAAASTSASAQVPGARAIDRACPSATPSAQFADVAGGTHGFAIDCVVMWQVAQGLGSNRYDPSGRVTRAQMATFLARAIERSGGRLPADVTDAFRDDAGSTHEPAINRLAAAGVVQGKAAGRYDPQGAVTRAQMATFIARAYEYRAGRALTDGSAYFTDVAGTHAVNVGRVARAGITGGVSETRYDPDGYVTRAQMASFLARLLDLLVAEGRAQLPPAPDVYFIRDMRVPGGTSVGFERPASTNGTLYPRSLVQSGCLRATDYSEFNLGRDFRRFRATVGLSDDSRSDARTIVRVYLDGRQVRELTLRLGQSTALDLDVSGVLRLRLERQNLERCSAIVWGDARLNAW